MLGARGVPSGGAPLAMSPRPAIARRAAPRAPWALTALAALACGSPDPEGQPPAPAAEGGEPIGLVGCERSTPPACDVSTGDCARSVAQLAACLRDVPSVALPPITVIAESEAEVYLVEAAPGPSPSDPLAEALIALRLSRRASFDPAMVAQQRARNWVAFYDASAARVVVVQHAAPRDWSLDTPVLLHELIHAIQDDQHDLAAFRGRYGQGVEGELRALAVIEGEARYFQTLYQSSLFGLDPAQVDFARTFASVRQNGDDWLWAQEDLLSATRFTMPYAYGAEYLHEAIRRGRVASPRDLFEMPPATVRDVMGELWEGAQPEPSTSLPPAEAPEGATPPATDTSLGGWPLYALLHAALDEAQARALALDWRGDRLDAGALKGGGAWAVWQIHLAQEASAERVAAALSAALPGEPSHEVARRGPRVSVRLRTATPSASTGEL